ncbi:hypothetical protein BGZ60DRAFT_427947 [Tricladium varicosporioides]|nr:hypothetical protein BGZ60DRAFT_427947 [Hymenoscyphus varicosporioides]
MLNTRYIRLTLGSILFVQQALTQSTVSFFNFPEFQLLRSCAQSCIWGSYGSVADVLGCPSPWYDVCICNPKQQASVASYVSSCARSKCITGSNVDAPTAAAVYTDYCYSAGITTAGQASPTMSLDLKTVSLFQDSGYKVLRICAQACIWGSSGSVADFPGCPFPWYNACVCNKDQQSAIARNVGNCVTTKCTGTEDVATAMKVYTEYCSGAGYQSGLVGAKSTADPLTTSTSSNLKASTISSSATSSPRTTIQITTAVTVPSTTRAPTSGTSQTSTTDSSPTTAGSIIKSGLTTGGIIGIAISASCSVLGLIFGIGFKIWQHNRRRY